HDAHGAVHGEERRQRAVGGVAHAPDDTLGGVGREDAMMKRPIRDRTRNDGSRIQLTHLGAAGWEISDGERVILLDPYLSRLRVTGQFGTYATPSLPGDTRRIFGPDDELVPDPAAVDAHIGRADFILHSHSHFNHTIDMP